MPKINSVDDYIESHHHFSDGLNLLRSIIEKTELVETIKWNSPVYTIDGKNVVGMGAFKHHFGIWFFNGVFLKDEKNLLVTAQEKTKGLRQMRFESVDDINTNAVLAYIKEAIQNQKLGKEIKPEKTKTIVIPEALKQEFKNNEALYSCFKSLPPYKQKDYCEYIDTAKREATVTSRLEKIVPMILAGIGLNDKYKNC
ncbi:hypothetical protein GCM10007962_09260 [Yeosuana aromativorans]|uniref:YdhG-like domain-containing protein n=1 Tax=Yeosuana aromativorans TaxID=288019 RepID=A0A8J3BG76_9FLAO|nr:DUF1801 domain-containing protein [Yeosuana aromativorans]GGK17166.1 hypothetical protein GCM10007962_09260 [Yeosuana aromativorans]